MSARSVPIQVRTDRSHLLYNLAGIAILILLLAVGAAYLVDELGRKRESALPSLSDGDQVSQTISGKELHIPAGWFRYGEQVKDGFTNQIDLRLAISTANQHHATVDVTLLPRSRARTSASLLDSVYLHQFADGSLSGPTGLVGKQMQDSNGYAGESVWYDAISPNPFVAKCLAAVSERTPSQCVRTVYLPSGIAAVYTFDARVLDNWRDFDGEMQQWLSTIGAW